MLDPMFSALADELAARLTARHREHVEQLEAEIARLTRERDLALRYQAQDMRDMAARLRAVEAERDEVRAFAAIVIRDTMACLDGDNPGAARAVLTVGADAFSMKEGE